MYSISSASSRINNSPNARIAFAVPVIGDIIIRVNKCNGPSLISNSSKASKIMVCSVLNLTREYTGITDVNCYLLFVDLEKEDSAEKLESIINYAKDYCELTKKIYVFGMVSGNEEETKHIAKGDITKNLEAAKVAYEYKEINLSKPKDVSEKIMDVLVYCTKHPISGDDADKDGGQAHSCEIF